MFANTTNNISKCENCRSDCSECKNLNWCTKCYNGKYLIVANNYTYNGIINIYTQCIDNCPSGYYPMTLINNNNTCIPC